jgi:cell division protein FtsQ
MSRPPSGLAPALHFQRGEGGLRLKKVRRTAPPGLKQALVAFALVALTFAALHRATLFVLSWSKLEIRDVRLACTDDAVRADVARRLEGARWGNILLLDLAKVRARLEAIPWVKEARLRKVFPSSLEIGLIPRHPAALLRRAELQAPEARPPQLRRDAVYLVDREGVELERAGDGAAAGLPLLTDDAGFAEDRGEKLRRAWECLDGLAEAERLDVGTIDLTDPANAVLTFRSGPTRVFLGGGGFGPRLADFLKNRDRWTRAFGRLEYVDLRFDDRVYLKAAAPPPAAERGGAAGAASATMATPTAVSKEAR